MQPIFNEVLFALGILASFATIISAITPLITNLIRGGRIDPKIKARQQNLTSFIIGIGLFTISTAIALPNVFQPENSQTILDVYLFHHLASDDLGPVKNLVWSADSTKLASID